MHPHDTPPADPDHTPVRVVPAKRAWLEALVVGDAEFANRFGIDVAPDWAGVPEAVPYALAATRSDDGDRWGSHLIFDADGALVGFGGFKGAPTDGAVEIGYAVAPERQGRGIATAATRWMLDQARRAGTERVIAHTLAEPNPSTRVLERCGFVRTATVSDPDGDVAERVWRWEHRLGGD